jgi:hypothetical protein
LTTSASGNSVHGYGGARLLDYGSSNEP